MALGLTQKGPFFARLRRFFTVVLLRSAKIRIVWQKMSTILHQTRPLVTKKV
jgi:hypothetical protein